MRCSDSLENDKLIYNRVTGLENVKEFIFVNNFVWIILRQIVFFEIIFSAANDAARQKPRWREKTRWNISP